jgi:c-di-GMP-binding flagellar brake protein YcgR
MDQPLATDPTSARKFERVQIQLHVMYLNEKQVLDAQMLNLSVGGMAIFTQGELPVGEDAMVAFTLDSGFTEAHTISTICEIKHCTFQKEPWGFVCGLQFERLTPSEAYEVEQFLGLMS